MAQGSSARTKMSKRETNNMQACECAAWCQEEICKRDNSSETDTVIQCLCTAYDSHAYIHTLQQSQGKQLTTHTHTHILPSSDCPSAHLFPVSAQTLSEHVSPLHAVPCHFIIVSHFHWRPPASVITHAHIHTHIMLLAMVSQTFCRRKWQRTISQKTIC